MRAKHAFALLVLWLGSLLPAVVLLMAYGAERDPDPLSLIGGIVFAGGCALIAPSVAVMNSSGRWYSAAFLQPVFEHGEGFYSWKICRKNELWKLLTLGPIFGYIGVLAVTGGLADGRRGAFMPFYGVILLTGLVWLLLWWSAVHVEARMKGDTFTLRNRILPFFVVENVVTGIRSVHFWEVDDLVPLICRLKLQGDVETTWVVGRKRIRRPKQRELVVSVPYFRNATPEQVNRAVQRYA